MLTAAAPFLLIYVEMHLFQKINKRKKNKMGIGKGGERKKI